MFKACRRLSASCTRQGTCGLEKRRLVPHLRLMSREDVRSNRYLIALVLLSTAILAMAVVLRIGISHVEAPDSMGRPMGFNDPLSAEHHWMMVQNFKPADLFRVERLYDWVLLVMHGIGAWLLLSARCSASRITRWFFAVQPILFPLGVLFIWLPFLWIPSMVMGDFGDREGFVDIPYTAFMSQPIWILTSLITFFAMRAPGLGLAKVWGAIKATARVGGQTFVATVK